MPLVIRKTTVMDLEDLYQIERECFASESFPNQLLEYFLKTPNFVNLIAFSDGKAVGFIVGSIENFRGEITGHIYTIDVKHEYRRRGIGSSLINALERIFAEKGVETCYLEVRTENIAAKRLYLKHGYKQFETIRNYYGLGADGIRLKKDLRLSQ